MTWHDMMIDCKSNMARGIQYIFSAMVLQRQHPYNSVSTPTIFGDDETMHAPRLSLQLLYSDCTCESIDRVNILKLNRNNLCGPILMHALQSRSAAYTYGRVPHIMAEFLV